MAQVYIYLPNDEAKHASLCGLKLSDRRFREFSYQGKNYFGYTGFLNPNDDGIHKNDKAFSCIALEVDERYCFVANQDFFQSELYYSTITPVNKYRLGDFRSPEAIVCCTVLPKNVSIQTGRYEMPLLYENSEALYIDNVQSSLSEGNERFNNDQLLAFFEMLASTGQFQRTEKADCIIFSNQSENYSFRKADFSEYQLKG